ncbi:MAG: choice-of-anchor B family protein [Gemmatimonadetes bacterium]|nr:choice-of-anchor B family protein [Gemmatimonadota bacterium]
MRPVRSRCLIPSCLGLLALASSASAQSAVPPYNVTLLANLDEHTGVNDCWGYSAPGVEIAIYGHQSGTAFVDATDPENAAEYWSIAGPTSIWRDIKTYQHYAYIVTEGTGFGTGLQIVDLANPLSPVHVGTYTDGAFSSAHNLWIDEAAGIAYACGAAPGGGMHVLSLADPENPVELDFFDSYYIHDLFVGGGRGYAGAINSGSLRIMNTTNPANITTVASHFYNGANTHNAWPNVAGTHVCTSDEVGGGHFKMWDITNLSGISLTSEWRPPDHPISIIHNILNKNDLAYISWYAAGARILDITDPYEPVEVGFYDTSNREGGGFEGCWGVYPFRGDDVFYASDRQNGLFILRFDGDFAGEIQGTVRNLATSAPLDSAHVRIIGTQFDYPTDGAGTYSGLISGGSYQVVTTRFGYQPDTANVVIPPNGVLVHDVDLQAIPNGTVEITLLSARDGLPIAGARGFVFDSPIVNLETDANGQVTIPGLPAGIPWTARFGKFGFELTDVAVVPAVGTTTPVSANANPGFYDDFQNDQAWVSGAPGDDATDGLWERAIPFGSYWLGPVGPDVDASGLDTGFAWVTENHTPSFVGTSDVDNGRTTLLSPVFDASGFGTVGLRYQRWFSNRAPSQSDDEFRTDVSTDGGSTWTNLETLSFGTDSWAEVTIDLSSVVTPTATMQLRFVAEDLGDDQYVEAGVDEVALLFGATDAPGGIAAGPLASLSLSAPVPNPARDRQEIRFDVPAAGPATLAVYDVAGRRVATLLGGSRVAAGRQSVTWSGRDDAGREVAPGVYFAKLEAAGEVRTRKITRIR